MLTIISNTIQLWITQSTITASFILTLLMPFINVHYGIYFGVLTILLKSEFKSTGKQLPQQILNEQQKNITVPYVD